MNTPSSSEQELRSLYGYPQDYVVEAYATQLDDASKIFIQACPFMVLSSTNDSGYLDMSPRGGEPGFIQIVDDKNIAFLDQMGNRKLHTLSNLTRFPNVGLLFMIPGVEEVLRAYGVARAIHDEQAIQDMGGNPKRNKSIIQIQIEKIFPHCPTALKKSALWEHDKESERPQNIPDLMEIAQSMTQSRTE